MNSSALYAPYLKTISSFDGIDLSCEIRGSKNDPLVFVHGWTCNRDFFASQAEYYSKSYQWLALALLSVAIPAFEPLLR